MIFLGDQPVGNTLTGSGGFEPAGMAEAILMSSVDGSTPWMRVGLATQAFSVPSGNDYAAAYADADLCVIETKGADDQAWAKIARGAYACIAANAASGHDTPVVTFYDAQQTPISGVDVTVELKNSGAKMLVLFQIPEDAESIYIQIF